MSRARDARRKNRKRQGLVVKQIGNAVVVVLTRPAIRGMKQRPRNAQKAKDRGYPT